MPQVIVLLKYLELHAIDIVLHINQWLQIHLSEHFPSSKNKSFLLEIGGLCFVL